MPRSLGNLGLSFPELSVRICLKGLDPEVVGRVALGCPRELVNSRSSNSAGHPVIEVAARGLRSLVPGSRPFATLGQIRVLDAGATLTIIETPSSLPEDSGQDLVDAVSLSIGRELARSGYAVVHAAGLAVASRRVFAFGASGAGKSTLAAATIAASGCVVSDDGILLKASHARGLVGEAFREDLSIRKESIPILERSSLRVGPPDGEGRVTVARAENEPAFLREYVPDELWRVSVGTRADSDVVPLSQADLLASLLPSTYWFGYLCQLPYERERLLATLRRLAESCRGYHVLLGTRLLEDPTGELTRILDQTTRSRL